MLHIIEGYCQHTLIHWSVYGFTIARIERLYRAVGEMWQEVSRLTSNEGCTVPRIQWYRTNDTLASFSLLGRRARPEWPRTFQKNFRVFFNTKSPPLLGLLISPFSLHKNWNISRRFDTIPLFGFFFSLQNYSSNRIPIAPALAIFSNYFIFFPIIDKYRLGQKFFLNKTSKYNKKLILLILNWI